jgi:hypothetical protein
MTVFFDTLQESNLGYSAIFACIGLGFLFLRKVDEGEVGPGYWSLSFFLNSLGFLFWSGAVPLVAWQYYLVGEIFHVSGFLTLVCGAYRFTGNRYKRWNLLALGAWIAVWMGALLLLRSNPFISSFLFKASRALLFVSAGIMILRERPKEALVVRRLTGWSLIAWGMYVMLFAVLRVTAVLNLVFGFLVGFQVLAAIGMTAMVMERMKLRAEERENQIKRLEGLLPICSYCKKIRDENNEWHTMESYIEERSTAEFSHGICPECFEKYHPDKDK